MEGWREKNEGVEGWKDGGVKGRRLFITILNSTFVLPLWLRGLGRPPLIEKSHRAILHILYYAI